MKKQFLPILFFMLPLVTIAQSGKLVFNDSILHTIKVKIDDVNWFQTLEADYKNNADSSTKFPEIYRPCVVEFDGTIIPNSGIREKGNFSNTNNNGDLKKPFKIAFDEFVNQNFDGIKKINLNNGTDDPSMIREALVYKLMRDAGLQGCRTSFAKLFVNNTYWGLYELVENIDKVFLKDKYGAANNDGNLYKTTRTGAAYLKWIDADSNSYNKSISLKSNAAGADWVGLIHFIDVVNNTPPDEMKTKLSEVFDVENYLKILAIEKLVYSFDSYWGGGNNFNLYEHPDGRIRWLPWDFNETLSDHKEILLKLLLTSPNRYLVPTNKFDDRPLLKAIFSVPEWKTKYLDDVCELLSTNFQTEKIAPVISLWQNEIRTAYEADANKLNTMADFNQSLWHDVHDVIDFKTTSIAFDLKISGVLPFINQQINWATDELKMQAADCNFSPANNHSYSLFIYPNPATDFLKIKLNDSHLNYSNLQLINTLGQIVFETSWNYFGETEITIDVSALPKGFYFIKKIDADGRFGVGKLVIE